MGLDQYWLVELTKEQQALDLILDNNNAADYWLIITDNEEKTYKEFYYHRKVPRLQHFMRGKYLYTNIENGFEFNGEYLEVTKDICEELIDKCNNKQLYEKASGLFWGSHHADHYEEILEAANKALEYINNGLKVLYTGNF